MNAQPAMILQNIEALAAGTAGVEVYHKLIHHLLQCGQIPPSATNAFHFLLSQTTPPQIVTVGRS